MTTRARRLRRALVVLLTLSVAGMTPATLSDAAPVGLPADTAAEVAYPEQHVLAEPAEHPGDASLRLGLAAYDDLAPRLNALQAASDRVGAEVVGTSVQGRPIHLVTVTAPEDRAEAARQAAMRASLTARPAAAARDRTLAADYKLPVLVTANIHGDEWEGTDAALRLVEELATSTDPDVLRLLASTRVHLVLSANPDGRVAGTRENAAGFDLNRDLLTVTQPETAALRQVIVDTQPVLLLDLHGYVNGTLVDPTTGPHGENYEYDLFLGHAWPNALGIEAAIEDLGYGPDDGVNPPQIPLRDWHEGWDDWPPIFTPQYAALHGAVAHTVEVPLRVNRADYHRPETELRRRATVNAEIAHAAVTASLDYALGHRAELLADQIEVFRRARAGERPRPVTDAALPHIPADDLVLTDYPGGYLVPVGSRQRSEPAAARLVRALLDHDVEVRRTTAPATVAGATYPAGSYLVDLRQPKRGMARAILGPGTDISGRVDRMYDVSAWSLALLWGADVVTVPRGAPLPPSGAPVQEAYAAGGVAGPGDLLLRLDDPADLTAANQLLGRGARVRLLPDGAVLVDEQDRVLAEEVAAGAGVSFGAVTGPAEGPVLAPLTVAAHAAPEEVWALRELGFEVVPVDPAGLAGLDPARVDVLFVSRRVDLRALDAAGRAGLRHFLSEGGALVGQGEHGAALNEALDLLEVTPVAGTAEANGVVAVTSTDGPVASRVPAHTFVEAPVWFRVEDEDVVVDQRLVTDDPLVSGHWRGTAGAGGPSAAAGQPVVVRGTSDEGSPVVLFGSDPLFRAHPKGQFPLVGRALLWAAAQTG